MRTLRQRTKSTSLVMSPAASSLVVKNGLRPLTLPLTMTGDRSALPQQPTCLTKLLLRAQSPKAFVSSASVATRFGVAVVAGAAVQRSHQHHPASPRIRSVWFRDRPSFPSRGHLFTARSWTELHAPALVYEIVGSIMAATRGAHWQEPVGRISGIHAVRSSSPELKSGRGEMLNCRRRSATSIRARYGQWAGVKCVPRSTSAPHQ